MKRVVCLIIDQLTGHWEESVKIEETNLPPVNVAGYHQLGLIPNFSYLINNGLWVKKPWNKGICDTPHGMKYIATGVYLEEKHFEPQNRQPCYYNEKHTSFPVIASQYYRKCNRKFVSGIFGCASATDDFLFGGCYAVYLPSDVYRSDPYADQLVWRKNALPWLKETHDWKLAVIYFAVLDTIGDKGCPSYTPKSNNPKSSKHSYIRLLDGLIGNIREFLRVENLWEETYFVITSDHGAHLGCSSLAQEGVKANNWWQGHARPYDCKVWNTAKNNSTGIYAGGPRRITFLVSGGALNERFRGKYIDQAEIIDVAPTIAHFLDIPFKSEGRNILEGYEIKTQEEL